MASGGNGGLQDNIAQLVARAEMLGLTSRNAQHEQFSSTGHVVDWPSPGVHHAPLGPAGQHQQPTLMPGQQIVLLQSNNSDVLVPAVINTGNSHPMVTLLQPGHARAQEPSPLMVVQRMVQTTPINTAPASHPNQQRRGSHEGVSIASAGSPSPNNSGCNEDMLQALARCISQGTDAHTSSPTGAAAASAHTGMHLPDGVSGFAGGGGASACGGLLTSTSGTPDLTPSLYVKNLSADTTELCLYRRFAPFGALRSCKVHVDRAGNCRGVGFVNYLKLEDALTAQRALHGTPLPSGLKLHVTIQAPRSARVTPAQTSAEAQAAAMAVAAQQSMPQMMAQQQPPNQFVPLTWPPVGMTSYNTTAMPFTAAPAVTAMTAGNAGGDMSGHMLFM